MLVIQVEWWVICVGLVMVKNGVNFLDNFLDMGMVGMVKVGFEMVVKIFLEDVWFFLDELMKCVQVVLDLVN